MTAETKDKNEMTEINETVSTKRILVFTGHGKGKTTAALGTALRAWGHGQRVAIVHFGKSRRNVGEVMALDKIPEIEQYITGLGFLPPLDDPDFVLHQEAARKGLKQAADLIRSGRYQLIVLDEICWAASRQLFGEEHILELLDLMADDTALLLTGRNAGQAVMDRADTVTEMKVLKHGYNEGIAAQDGIEK